MPSIYDLKPRFQQLLQPLLEQLHQWGISANQITVAALWLSLVGGGLTFLSPGRPALLWLIPVILFVRMALNALDGMMARQYHQQSTMGAVLNEVGDVVSDAALYLPWVAWCSPADALHQFFFTLSVIGFVIFGIMTEFCGVLAQALTGQRRYDGPMGKSDRAFFIGAIAILLIRFPDLVPMLHWAFGLACIFLLQSCINRLLYILNNPQPEVSAP